MHDQPMKELGTFCRVCFDIAGSQDCDAQAFALLDKAMGSSADGKVPDVLVSTYTSSGSPVRIRTRDVSLFILITPETRESGWDRDRAWRAEKKLIAPDFLEEDEKEPYA